MKLFGRSSETAPSITLPRWRLIFNIYMVALASQVVTVASMASSANAQGANVPPIKAILAFLSLLLLFAFILVAFLLVLALAVWVLRIRVASESNKQQRAVFMIIRGLFVFGLVVWVPYATRGLWMKPEYFSMFPLPIFYAGIGLLIWRLIITSPKPIDSSTPSRSSGGTSPHRSRQYDMSLGEDTDTGQFRASTA